MATQKQVIFDVLAVAKAQGFDAAAREVDKLNDSATKSQKNLKLLSTSIVALGPAVVPVAAAGSAALLGLGGAAGAAALAFKGLSDQWKAGTLQAQPVGKQISALNNNLHGLEAVSATAIGPGLTEGLKKVNALTPTISQDMEKLSTQLGEIAGHTGAGLAQLFVRLNPLFVSLGDQLVRGSASFEKWATSSSGVTKFAQYAQAQLPQVEATLLNLAQAVQHIVVGIAPLGGGTLSTLKIFSDVVKNIPVSVIQNLAPALVGLKVAGTVNAGMSNLAGSFEKIGGKSAAAGRVADILSGVGKASFIAAPLLLTLAQQFGNSAQKAQQAAQQTDAFRQALKDSNGAITQNIRDLVAQNLQQSGVLDAANKLGLALPNVTDAVLNQSKAQRIVNQLQKEYPDFTQKSIDASGLSTKAYEENFNAADQVIRALRGQAGELDNARQAYRNEAAAAGSSASATDRVRAALNRIPKDTSFTITAHDDALLALIKVHHEADLLNNKQIDIYTYLHNVVLPTVRTFSGSHDSHRASGGRVLRGQRYDVNELGQELFVQDGDGAYLLPGGPHMWTAPASGQIINASTVKSLRSRVAALGSASLSAIPGAARSAVSAVASILPFGSPITRALEQEDKQLEALVTRRLQIANRLKAANTQLAQEQQNFNQEALTVQRAVTGSFDLLNAGKDVYGNISAAGILSDLRGSVGNAATFASDLRRLKGRIPNSVLQQLAEAGPSALPTLQALVGATPAQLRQFSALEGQLGGLGAAAGRVTASALYGAQIASTERLIRSLQAQEKATERLERQLGQTIVKSVNISIHGGSAQEIVKTLDRYFAHGGTLNSHGRIR